MKAMILAAGMGNRMRPLTLTTPKPLLKVADKPLIMWHIEKLAAVGVRDIVINAAYLKEILVRELGDGAAFGVKIHWSLEDDCLETAGGIIQALPLLGDQPFIVVNGDVWSRVDFTQLTEHNLNDDLAHLLLVNNPEHHPEGDFFLHEDRVYDEAGAHRRGLTFAGISLLSPQLFIGLEAGRRPLAPLLRQAMQQKRVSGHHLKADWVDVGTPQRLEQLDHGVRTGVR